MSNVRPVERSAAAVLIVEDDFLLAMRLTAIVERRGWQVLGPARSVDVALRLLASEKPDVAILDVNLKGRLVIPVAEVLRERGIPFVIASAYPPEQIAALDVLHGAPMLAKPVEEHQLLATLAELLSPSR